jgi:two-component system, NarL family, sensor histidine kinase DesK
MKADTTCIEEDRQAPQIGTQRRSGYIWLAYSVFFFLEPFLRHNLRFWLECIGIYAVFIALYVTYMHAHSSRQRHLLLSAFYLLGLFSYPVNSGATSFFIYSAAFLPFAVESVPRVRVILLLQSLGVIAETLWLHSNPINAAAAVFFIAVVGSANTFMAQQKRADAKLRAAREENAQLATVAERERIARDLHDVLGHTLSVIVLKAELAKRLMQNGPQQNLDRAVQEIADVESTARTALAEVRETIGGFRSQGLAAELAHARHTLDAAGVTLTWEPPPAGWPALTATEETVLSLSVREAVTNIVRHAEATRCTMRLATTDGFHALLVEDDGPYTIQQEGNGLRGMRERVATLGGRFSIRSEQGTRLLIELPITATSQKATA